jgi:hypothetical protein
MIRSAAISVLEIAASSNCTKYRLVSVYSVKMELPPFSGVLTACDGEFHLGGAFVVHG